MASRSCSERGFSKTDPWGYLIGDEESAYDISRRALNTVFRAYDGRGPRTVMTEKVLSRLSRARESSPPDALPLIYGMSATELASLAPVVMEAAEEGDPAALSVLVSCARDLVQMIVAVAKKLGLDSPPVAFTGGALKSRVYAGLVEEELSRTLPGATVTECRYPPSVGAAIVAYKRRASRQNEGGHKA